MEQIKYDFTTKVLKPEEVNYVIYHGNCMDGFTSAMCCWYWRKCNKLSNDEDAITFFGSMHQTPPPSDLEGKNVLICDFSYRKKNMEKVLEKANKVLILDHHKTSQKDLEYVDDSMKAFDMNHCGSYITWRFFFGYDEKVPRMILYVEDNDCWFKKLPLTEEFTYYMSSVAFEFDEYVKFLDDDYLDTVVFPMGKGMVKINNKYIDKMINNAIPHFMQIGNKYYFVGHIQQELLRNELGNTMFKHLPFINFSVVYGQNVWKGCTYYSLRSDFTRSDVSVVAEKLGGGGHRNASGCRFNHLTNSLPFKIIDKYSLYYKLSDVYMTICRGMNILLFNTTYRSKQMASYLMQERTNGVQEGSFILMNNPDSGMTGNLTYDAAIVYNFTDKSMSGYINIRDKCDEESRNKIKSLFDETEIEMFHRNMGKFTKTHYLPLLNELNFSKSITL